MTSVDEDPKRLVEMYAQFVEVRQKFLLANTADYPEFVQQGWFNLFLWAVHDEVYGIANKINKFWRQLHSLAAWNIILPSLNEVDQYNALVEFVSPTADDCLTAPYSIKSALVTSVCRISHQTKLRSNKDYREILDAKKRLRFPDAEKLAKGYENWPDLKEAFSKLNNDDYKS